LLPIYPSPAPKTGFLKKQTKASSYKFVLPLVVRVIFEIWSISFSTKSFFINTKIDTKIAGLILFSGIYYPTDSLYTIMPLGINHSLWEYLCGEKFKDCDTCKSYKYYNALNVGEYVTADFPPIFISYSKTDIFCKGNGEKLVNNLKDLNIPFFSVYSITNMHDWQENMFTKSSKMTLKHFDSFMKNLLSEKTDSTYNSSITIKLGKIVKE